MNIASISFPRAHFSSKAALDYFHYEATSYEKVVSAFQADGDDLALWEGLERLGYTHREIS